MAPKPEDVHALIERHIAAWCNKSGDDVAASYTEDAVFTINRGDPMTSHQEISDMVKGFCDEFPDVVLELNHSFVASDHAVYVWTFKGHQAGTGKYAEFQGWEEWELSDEPRVKSSLGWFDAEDYERQLA